MQTFYPPIKTYAEHRLPVESPHEIYIAECGNPEGLPVLIVHSGPGAGCQKFHRRYFDPRYFRIILFDQRGCGQSTPYAELTNNNTQALISDMEAIREHLNIRRWVLFGGAWGSTLSMLYAQQYPEHVHSMVLRGVFLGRKRDIDWMYHSGASKIFPDYWNDFIEQFDENERNDLISAYCERLTGNDQLAQMAAAKSWSLWQARTSALQPHSTIMEHFSDPHFAVGLARIESHFFKQHCFIEDNQILDNIGRIQNIPAYIVHGRYDIVCPLDAAWTLHRAWPNSQLYIVRDAGHAENEPGIIDALIYATKKIMKNDRDYSAPA